MKQPIVKPPKALTGTKPERALTAGGGELAAAARTMQSEDSQRLRLLKSTRLRSINARR